MASIKKIVPGLRFNNLTVIKELERLILPCGQKNRVCLCICDCGTEKTVRLLHLKRNKIKSCGCLQGEQHRMSKTKLYHVWWQMMNRCHKSYTSDNNIKNYQNRGIIVCDEWRNSFLSFHKWSLSNGYNEGLQIDRENNNGNYEPSNCRWVTREVNASNKRTNVYVKIKGVTKTIAEWAKFSGIKYGTLRLRMFELKWPHDKLLNQTRQGKYNLKSV